MSSVFFIFKSKIKSYLVTALVIDQMTFGGFFWSMETNIDHPCKKNRKGEMHFFILFFGEGLWIMVLKDYSLLCDQGSLLTEFRGPYLVPGIKSVSATCQTSLLISVLYSGPEYTLFVICSLLSWNTIQCFPFIHIMAKQKKLAHKGIFCSDKKKKKQRTNNEEVGQKQHPTPKTSQNLLEPVTDAEDVVKLEFREEFLPDYTFGSEIQSA